jgi:hypothetical protein
VQSSQGWSGTSPSDHGAAPVDYRSSSVQPFGRIPASIEHGGKRALGFELVGSSRTHTPSRVWGQKTDLLWNHQ